MPEPQVGVGDIGYTGKYAGALGNPNTGVLPWGVAAAYRANTFMDSLMNTVRNITSSGSGRMLEVLKTVDDTLKTTQETVDAFGGVAKRAGDLAGVIDPDIAVRVRRGTDRATAGATEGIGQTRARVERARKDVSKDPFDTGRIDKAEAEAEQREREKEMKRLEAELARKKRELESLNRTKGQRRPAKKPFRKRSR